MVKDKSRGNMILEEIEKIKAMEDSTKNEADVNKVNAVAHTESSHEVVDNSTPINEAAEQTSIEMTELQRALTNDGRDFSYILISYIMCFNSFLKRYELTIFFA